MGSKSIGDLPSGNDCYIALEHGHGNGGVSMIFPLNMVIFRSHVRLPDGKANSPSFFGCSGCRMSYGVVHEVMNLSGCC